ncbi:Ken-052 [Symbiodinium necroappetens]|uniref:Ken-052 protein n=1 Tax=Symbiodinium necroappetens TaxID=1628268 RepID=A0A812PEZ1_9DINO|nr:Ken-052 [Symbiodinium necroappetens]
MERMRSLAQEALSWPFLDERQRLVWAAVLEFDANLPPWFYARQNITRRHLGVDLFSLDGKRAVLCRAGNATHKDVRRFLRTAKCVNEAGKTPKNDRCFLRL